MITIKNGVFAMKNNSKDIKTPYEKANKGSIVFSYLPFMSEKAALFLGYLSKSIHTEWRCKKDKEGVVWYQQNYEWLAKFINVSIPSLRRIKKTLLDLQLIKAKSVSMMDKTTLWTVNYEQLNLFTQFTESVHLFKRYEGRIAQHVPVLFFKEHSKTWNTFEFLLKDKQYNKLKTLVTNEAIQSKRLICRTCAKGLFGINQQDVQNVRTSAQNEQHKCNVNIKYKIQLLRNRYPLAGTKKLFKKSLGNGDIINSIKNNLDNTISIKNNLDNKLNKLNKLNKQTYAISRKGENMDMDLNKTNTHSTPSPKKINSMALAAAPAAPARVALTMRPESLKAKVKETVKPNASKKKLQPCRFVECWNRQAFVPKCRLGTKSYEIAREFFKAHRFYEAGTVKFPLTQDEQKRIGLQIVTKTAKEQGGVVLIRNKKARSYTQMIQDIELAAKAFDPQCVPLNKKYLKRSLPAFLYNPHSDRHGQTSFFLERLWLFVPRTVEVETRKVLLEKASESEIYMARQIQHAYNLANGYDKDYTLSHKDFKSILNCSKDILKCYDEMPIEQSGKLIHHIGSCEAFTDWWTRFVRTHLWDGMPVAAFSIKNQLWRKFVAYLGKTLHVDMRTGQTVYETY